MYMTFHGTIVNRIVIVICNSNRKELCCINVNVLAKKYIILDTRYWSYKYKQYKLRRRKMGNII